VLVAVQEHETDREIKELKTLTDVLYVANKIANRKSSWRDPEFDGRGRYVDARTIFDADTLAEIIEESEEEVHSLKSALGAG
jgi:HD superfamily phosphohydrolase YqeK